MAMCTRTDWQYPSSNGVNTIHATIWVPADGPIRAVIQITHGMMEHIRRYDRFARALCARGYAVCGDDHLGHGRTAASREELGFFSERDGWLRAAGVRDVTLRLYPDARHELHNELCRDEFLEDIDGWMKRHIQAQG